MIKRKALVRECLVSNLPSGVRSDVATISHDWPGQHEQPRRFRPSLRLNDKNLASSRKKLQRPSSVWKEPINPAIGLPSFDWRFRCNQTITFLPAAD